MCDRYADSTLAYQGYGSGQPLDRLRALGEYATGGLRPNLTILFDLPAEVGLGRKAAEANRFENHAGLAFHRRVRDGFLAIAAAEPDRYVVLDATKPPEALESEVLAAVRSRLATAILKSSEPKPDPVRMDR